jgi:hypothetical protein
MPYTILHKKNALGLAVAALVSPTFGCVESHPMQEAPVMTADADVAPDAGAMEVIVADAGYDGGHDAGLDDAGLDDAGDQDAYPWGVRG